MRLISACILVQLAGRVQKHQRRFDAMTQDLQELANWLRQFEVTQVAMESSGVYWEAVGSILEGQFTVVLVNAQHIKNVLADSCRPRFFLPIRVLSRLFRRLLLKYLEEAFDSGRLRFFSSLAVLRDPQAFRLHLDPVRNLKWVVYAKPPFAGPQQVVDYVGRYTHRVAISNHRIVDIEGADVKFTWRDYRDNNQQK